MDGFLADLIAALTVEPKRLLQADMILHIVLQILLMAASAFFSGSETALFSLSRLDLQKLRRERNPRFDTLQTLLEQPRQLIISILCGNEIINVAAVANMTGILVALYGIELGGMVISHLRHIPREGEYIIQAGYRFTVEQATERGIVKLRAEQPG